MQIQHCVSGERDLSEVGQGKLVYPFVKVDRRMVPLDIHELDNGYLEFVSAHLPVSDIYRHLLKFLGAIKSRAGAREGNDFPLCLAFTVIPFTLHHSSRTQIISV